MLRPKELASGLAQRAFVGLRRTGFASGPCRMPVAWFQPVGGKAGEVEAGMVTCLRSVLMKPEHEAWLDRIWTD